MLAISAAGGPPSGSREQLGEADRASFAGTVAHDLNSPLTVIEGWTEAIGDELASGQPDAATRATAMLAHVTSSLAQVRVFVADVLAHTLAEDRTLHCEAVALGPLVADIATARERPGVAGSVQTGDLGQVWADPLLVRQVLENLIGNAPQVRRARHRAAGPGRDHAALRALARRSRACNGIGIAPHGRKRVFENIHRASTGGYTGTGVGLAICRRIVNRHGGTIAVQENPDGVGSCFTFALPRSPDALQHPTPDRLALQP